MSDLAPLAFSCSERVFPRRRNQQTANKINDFVSDATKGLIKDLIKPSSIDGLTRMALVNAIYFKGDWELEFPEEDTAPTPFKIRLIHTR